MLKKQNIKLMNWDVLCRHFSKSKLFFKYNLDAESRYEIYSGGKFNYFPEGESVSLIDKILFLFFAFHNIDKLRKQIGLVITSNQVEINDNNIDDSMLILCEYFSRNIKSEFKNPISKHVREFNVSRINKKQEIFLKNKTGEDYTFSKTQRPLNLYFRKRSDGSPDMDFFEFVIVYYILDWYVLNGYSKVFTSLHLTSRTKDQYPQFMNDLFPNLRYSFYQNWGNKVRHLIKDKESSFTVLCSFMSNTIHFVDGTFEEAEFGSIPIVPLAIYGKNDAIKRSKDFVIMNLCYDKIQSWCVLNKIDKFKVRIKDKSGDFITVMKEVLRAVQELEERMLREV